MNTQQAPLTKTTIQQALQEVKDPEIPIISVVELGIIRDINIDDHDTVTIKITPTFAGCPALDVMRQEIKEKIHQLGAPEVHVQTTLHPPWTSDNITPEGRQKLKTYGLSPPPQHGGDITITFYEPAACPRCDSKNTTIKNTFGPTLCRAIYVCNNCQEPFEQFKPL